MDVGVFMFSCEEEVPFSEKKSSNLKKTQIYIFVLIDYEPQTICEHLQYLFALLQNSNRRYIDPSGFVKALGLDTGQQQVRTEFFFFF